MLNRVDPDGLEHRSAALVERLAVAAEKLLIPYHRAEVAGAEHIPGGGALFVGNHNSMFYTPETYLLGVTAYRRGGLEAVPYGLAQQWMISLPGLNPLLPRMGGVRACPENGRRLLEAGRNVMVYPGGDLDAMRPFRHRHRIVFDRRRGYVRLALETGAPIVPFVSAGAHSTLVILDDLRPLARWLGIDRRLRVKAFPLCISLPWGLTIGPPVPFLPFPSKILCEILPPIRFSRTGAAAARDEHYVESCALEVEAAMQTSLTRLAQRRRAERLARFTERRRP